MTEEVAEGIYRLGNRTVNWWAVTEDEGITLVDAGLTGQMGQLTSLLTELERPITDVKAVLLTHADVDHIGVAEDLRREGAVVYIHAGDAAAARGDVRPLPMRSLLSLWRPSALTAIYEYARDGALKPRFLRETVTAEDGELLPVPGKPRLLHVPGHTAGNCAFYFEARSALFSGDALVTADAFTGKREPTLLPAYDNTDHGAALDSLRKLASIEAELVLPGHGEVWRGGVSEAVRRALA